MSFQSKPLDADVKVTPQNLTLSLRPGNPQKSIVQFQKLSIPTPRWLLQVVRGGDLKHFKRQYEPKLEFPGEGKGQSEKKNP